MFTRRAMIKGAIAASLASWLPACGKDDEYWERQWQIGEAEERLTIEKLRRAQAVLNDAAVPPDAMYVGYENHGAWVRNPDAVIKVMVVD